MPPKSRKSQPPSPDLPENHPDNSGSDEKKRKPRTATEMGDDGKIDSPTRIAHLAALLLQLHGVGSDFGRSSRTKDKIYRRAVDDARRLLDVAAGRTNEVIHAYQLFRQDEGAMSFGAIASRFEEYGWSGFSRNAVEPLIEDLVRSARKLVLEKLEQHDLLLSESMGYTSGPGEIHNRLERHFRCMITRTRLEQLVPDPRAMARILADRFMKEVSDHFKDLGSGRSMEAWEVVRGYGTFIEWVCSGAGYEKFFRDFSDMVFDFERADAIQFLFLRFGEGKLHLDRKLEQLKSLLEGVATLFSHCQSVPNEVREHLLRVIAALPDNEAEARRHAQQASEHFGPFVMKWRSSQSPGAQLAEGHRNELERISTSDAPTPEVASAQKMKVLNALEREFEDYRGNRHVRPYELFLFAAQHSLKSDKLAIKRSKLNPEAVPNDPVEDHLPILWAHNGNTLEEAADDFDGVDR